MIIFKGTANNDVILGTNGERAIIAGLKLLKEQGTLKQSVEAANLLAQLGHGQND